MASQESSYWSDVKNLISCHRCIYMSCSDQIEMVTAGKSSHSKSGQDNKYAKKLGLFAVTGKAANCPNTASNKSTQRLIHAYVALLNIATYFPQKPSALRMRLLSESILIN